MPFPEKLEVPTVLEDFDRFGANESASNGWRVDSLLNADFALCSTYPQTLAFPATAPTAVIKAAAAYRSRQRLPVLSWRDAVGTGTLVRAAQPCTSVLHKRSKADEEYLAHCFRASGASKLCLIDARSLAAAHANKFRGGGVEQAQRYGARAVEFCALRNVHKVRRVIRALREQPSAQQDGDGPSPAALTSWLRLQAALLRAAVRTARLLQAGAMVFLHCSDGWDRTPQISALAQVLLDPFYRTHVGFLTLIDKEWLAFGHRFQLRHILAQPIFLQFLDAVYQLLRQQPQAFAFSPDYLADILALHDGTPPGGGAVAFPRFPFDCDHDAQRVASASAGPADASHWAAPLVADASRAAAYANPAYSAPGQSMAAAPLEVLHVDARHIALQLWEPVRQPVSRTSNVGIAKGSVLACCWPSRAARERQHLADTESEATHVRVSPGKRRGLPEEELAGIELKEQ